VFVGVALPVIIMGSFLEISKIAIATYLHDKWKETYGVLKIYLTTALVILSIITSLGIYGLLSTGFQGNIAKLEINQKKIKNIEVKKDRFVQIKKDLEKDKKTLDNDISTLRIALSKNTTTQSVDRKTGQLITRANNANRQTFVDQLNISQRDKTTIGNKITEMNDSITSLELKIIDMESEELVGSELGSIKYISELLGWDIKRVANLFILILIFVFDPLAITLVIATNQAFKGKRKEKDVEQPHPTPELITPQVEIEDTQKLKETLDDYLEEPITDIEEEIDFEVEEPIGKIDEPIEELFEREDYTDIIPETKEPEPVETPEPPQVQPQPRRLSYANRNTNGKSLRINRF
jgi:hypothetical protein